MLRNMFKSKLHRATVTDANLNYEGSITIDKSLLEASGILEFERVDIWNVTNGARFSTYVLEGRAGSGEICLNGAAARHVQIGDKVIIATFGLFDEKELEGFKPVVIQLDDKNRIIDKNSGLV